MVDPLTGINAYNQVAKMATGSEDRPTNVESFSDMVNRTMETSFETIKAGEKTAMAHIAGEASLEELTTAVSNAEMTLRTVVSVRDRIVSAYQDIIKMPI